MSIVRHAPDLIDAQIDGDVITFDPVTGASYGLNPVATRIWALAGEGLGIADICDRLMAEYNVDRQTCETQVLELLNALHQAALIQVEDQADHLAHGG